MDVVERPAVASQCRYVSRMPSSRAIVGAQPRDVMMLTSRNLRGVAWRAVRPAGVEAEDALVADDLGDQSSQIGDRDVGPDADIDRGRLVIALHHRDACVGEIIDVKEASPRLARAPHRDDGLVTNLRLMDPADQRRQYMRSLYVEIVVRAIEIGRHHRDETAAIL